MAHPDRRAKALGANRIVEGKHVEALHWPPARGSKRAAWPGGSRCQKPPTPSTDNTVASGFFAHCFFGCGFPASPLASIGGGRSAQSVFYTGQLPRSVSWVAPNSPVARERT